MIDEATYRKMEKKYGLLGSWAVWAEAESTPKSNISDLSIFDQADILQSLNPEVVFVGLNISRDAIKTTWGNFHDANPRGTDFKMRYALRGTEWWGGYMTDIIKNYDEVNSMKVSQYLKHNPSYEKENVNIFLKELETLGAKNPTVIAVGGATHEILTRNFARQFRIVKIPHYAHRMSKENYRTAVAAALSS
jgi:hypothetical protein